METKIKKADRKWQEGKRILERIFQRDYDQGGVFVELTGISGSGKTSLSFNIADEIMNRYPDEPLFFRDSTQSPVQFVKLPNWRLFFEEGSGLEIIDKKNGEREPDVPIKTFSDFDELYDMAEGGMLNVVFFESPSKWIDFINYLRRIVEWQTVILDEYEDVCPERASGEIWERNEWFSRNAKQVRKGLTNVIGNTQSKADVDWRVRQKIMIYGYLYGAKVDQESPIKQGVVSSQDIGCCWFDHGHSTYGQIEFEARTPTGTYWEVVPEDDENHFEN